MRNISFTLTKSQMREGTKTVTRRLGWKDVRPYNHLMACDQCQGIKPGELQRIHPIWILSNQPEPLRRLIQDPDYGRVEALLEGFPDMDGPHFVEMFCDHMKVQPSQVVQRIHFRHVFPQDWIQFALAGNTTAFHQESRLHQQISAAFNFHGIPHEHEVKLLDGRVDFRVLSRIAVEVKVARSSAAAHRQTFRYLEDPTIDAAVIIAAHPMDQLTDSYTTESGTTKPIHLINLWQNAL